MIDKQSLLFYLQTLQIDPLESLEEAQEMNDPYYVRMFEAEVDLIDTIIQKVREM